MTGTPLDPAAIRAPTLAIFWEDDRFLAAGAARPVAESVPGGQLRIYPTGGHDRVGDDSEIRGAVDGFREGR